PCPDRCRSFRGGFGSPFQSVLPSPIFSVSRRFGFCSVRSVLRWPQAPGHASSGGFGVLGFRSCAQHWFVWIVVLNPHS
ncbi:hypothetical protein A2U01_0074276, partial [Trifolium medium]|nr:hypothetical protein [Trifolium medium]